VPDMPTSGTTSEPAESAPILLYSCKISFIRFVLKNKLSLACALRNDLISEDSIIFYDGHIIIKRFETNIF
jgi:hypothetical protein